MLFEKAGEEVTLMKRQVTTDSDGRRTYALTESGRIRGAFVRQSLGYTESAGARIPIIRYSFTTPDPQDICYGDVLKRSDGSRQVVVSKKVSPPENPGSLINFRQYLTEEQDYDGRAGSL